MNLLNIDQQVFFEFALNFVVFAANNRLRVLQNVK